MEPLIFPIITSGLLALQQGPQVTSGLCKKSYLLAWYIYGVEIVMNGDMNTVAAHLTANIFESGPMPTP